MTPKEDLRLALDSLKGTLAIAAGGGVPMEWVIRNWLRVIEAHMRVLDEQP